MRIVVTGASGYLGQEVVRLAVAARWEVLGVSRRRRVGGAAEWAAVDVREAKAIDALSAEWRPAAMIHAAYVQRGPEATTTIVDGSAAVAAAARAQGVRLVHVSTDLVFGGRPEHYTEDTARSPVDAYGRAKVAAEEAVADTCPSAVMVRPSLLFGTERPSRTQEAVLDAVDGVEPMSFFTDEVRCPSCVTDVAASLLALCDGRLAGVVGPLHLGGPEALSRYELACLVAAWAGRPPGLVRPGRRAELAEERPGHVVLDSRRAVRLGLVLRSPIAALAPASGAAVERRSGGSVTL